MSRGPVHLCDLRLTRRRDGSIRLSVDGAELLRADSAAAALRFVVERLERSPAEQQLAVLASALVGDVST